MRKLPIVALLSLTLLSSGCSNKNSVENIETSNVESSKTEASASKSTNLKYSTMDDEDTQNKVSNLLSEVGVKKADIDMLINSIQSYYKSVEGVELLNESQRLSDLQVPYNVYELSDKWLEKNPDYSDQNCRLTAFRLFNSFVNSESNLNYEQIDTTNLEFDLHAIKYNPNAKFSNEDMNKFANFFSNITVTDSNNVDKTAKEISSELEKRKISFKSNENISIINGYVPDTENNAVFVGHTGVAINTDKGIVFIEKYGFELPYQITLFKDKEELKEYMYDRLKTSFTGETQDYEPVIMENDKLM